MKPYIKSKQKADKKYLPGGEAQGLKSHTAFIADTGLFPSTHIRQHPLRLPQTAALNATYSHTG